MKLSWSKKYLISPKVPNDFTIGKKSAAFLYYFNANKE
jgi:hypothetical protein